MENEQIIWNYLSNEFSACGTAGLMGNLYAESGLVPTNLENQYEKKLGMSDKEYTNAVDMGLYNNFEKDSAGYGLAQWTYWTRKRDLLKFCKSKNKSIGDLKTQLAFLIKELKSKYKTVYEILKNAETVKEASDAVLLHFERPADQSENALNKRASYGESYYSKYANEKPAEKAKMVRYYVSTPFGLNVRKKAGTDYPIVHQMTYKMQFEVSETKEKDGDLWGYIPAFKGWSCLKYAEHV